MKRKGINAAFIGEEQQDQQDQQVISTICAGVFLIKLVVCHQHESLQ